MIEKLTFFLLFYPVLLFSLSFHESAHGWMANRYGDPTARLMGRISLNPLRHIDPIGTFLMPLLAMLSGWPLIGWAKPVPVNPLNLRDSRKDTLWISAAGPFTNFLLACVFAILNWGIVLLLPAISPHVVPGSMYASTISTIYSITHMGVILNLALAFFNLIPIYPLDGGGVIRGLLPAELVPKFDAVAKYGMIILLILLVTGALRLIFWPVQILAGIMLPA
jgi:Zn-dependent protease